MQKIFVRTTDDLENYDDFIRGDLKGVIQLAIPVMNVLEWPGICSYALNLPEEAIADIIYYRSPLILLANCISLGIIVTLLA